MTRFVIPTFRGKREREEGQKISNKEIAVGNWAHSGVKVKPCQAREERVG